MPIRNRQNSFSAILAIGAVALIFLAGCSKKPSAEGAELLTGGLVAKPDTQLPHPNIGMPDKVPKLPSPKMGAALPSGSGRLTATGGNPTGVIDYLLPNAVLERGDVLYSQNKKFCLFMQYDGNLVLYNLALGPIFATNTYTGSPIGVGARAIMQSDGNFAVYNKVSNFMVFQSATAGNPGATLRLHDDGNIVIYNAGNQLIWESMTNGMTHICTKLNMTDVLYDQQFYQTCDAKFRLNLYNGVLTANRKDQSETFRTAFGPVKTFVLLANGNAIAYTDFNRVVWESQTTGAPGSFVSILPNGQPALYNAQGYVTNVFTTSQPMAVTPPPAAEPGRTIVYRKVAKVGAGHFYTTTRNEGDNAFTLEGGLVAVYQSPYNSFCCSFQTPLMRCLSSGQKHFIATNHCQGEVTEGLLGYVSIDVGGDSRNEIYIDTFYNTATGDFFSYEFHNAISPFSNLNPPLLLPQTRFSSGNFWGLQF